MRYLAGCLGFNLGKLETYTHLSRYNTYTRKASMFQTQNATIAVAIIDDKLHTLDLDRRGYTRCSDEPIRMASIVAAMIDGELRIFKFRFSDGSSSALKALNSKFRAVLRGHAPPPKAWRPSLIAPSYDDGAAYPYHLRGIGFPCCEIFI